MKIVGIAILRTGKELQDPIPLVVVNDLSSYGFFQRQVSTNTIILIISIIFVLQ